MNDIKNNKNLTAYTQEISSEILDSIYLLDILDEIIDGSAKETTLIIEVRKKLKYAFDKIENCRTMISQI